MDGKTMDDDWRPLLLRASGEPSGFDVLHEGTPAWLDGSLWRWLMNRAAEGAEPMVARLERRLHVVLATEADRPFGYHHTAPAALLDRHWKSAGPDDRLILLDAILRDVQIRIRAAAEARDVAAGKPLWDAARELEAILAEGGSMWRAHIDPPCWSLVRRVNDTTSALVARVSEPATDAARSIRSAWNACYRLDPNYDLAYRDAVLAVEAVVLPVTVPDSPRASLGTAASHIGDTLARWSVGALDAKQIASGQTLHDMLKTLWHSQQRHASGDGTITGVTQPEAETAVSLAVLLVHWFSSGLARQDAV